MTKKSDRKAEAARFARWVLDEMSDDPRGLALVMEVIEELAVRARSRRVYSSSN